MFSRSSNKFTPRTFTGFHCVGYVKAAHGLRGEIYIQLQVRPPAWLKSLNKIQLLTPGSEKLSDHEFEYAKPHKEGLIMKLKTCTDRNQSELLRKSSVYIPESALKAKPGEEIYLKEIEGFTVIDPQDAVIGVIESFGTNGAQDLLEVRTPSGKEVLIPFVEAFIVHIDFDKQTVKMDLPPGLIDPEDE